MRRSWLAGAALLFITAGAAFYLHRDGAFDWFGWTAAERNYDAAYRKVRNAFKAADGRAPLRSDPVIAAALDALGDPAGSYGTSTFPASLAFNACGKGEELTIRYLFAPENGQRGSAARNQQRYESEWRPIGLFHLRCLARALEALAAMPREALADARLRHGLAVDATRDRMNPTAREGDIRLRPTKEVWRQVAMKFAILPILMSTSSSSESYRRGLVAAAAREAPTFAAALPLDKRAETLDSLTKTTSDSPAWAKADVERVLAALRDTSCTGLCARGPDD